MQRAKRCQTLKIQRVCGILYYHNEPSTYDCFHYWLICELLIISLIFQIAWSDQQSKTPPQKCFFQLYKREANSNSSHLRSWIQHVSRLCRINETIKHLKISVNRWHKPLQKMSQHNWVTAEALQLNRPFSPLVKAPLKDPPMRISPSCRSSRAKSRTGIGCRYTWKQLLSFRVTGRVRTKSSEKRNTCSLCEVTH